MHLSSFLPKNRYFGVKSSSDSTLFINNIDPEIPDEKLNKVLGNFGKIIELKVERHQEKNSFAYLKYDHPDYVQRALNEAQYKKVGRYEIIVMTPANRKKLNREGKLFIKGLNEETLASDLHKFFEQISRNFYVSLATDEDGRHLSTGYVHFFNPRDADRAEERLNGKIFNGRRLELSKWLPKEQRETIKSPQNLFISNLQNLSRNELEITYGPIFESFGEIQSLVFNENQSSAMLMYKYAGHAQEAFDNLKTLDGCSSLEVNWLKSREERAREAEEKNNRLYLSGLQSGVTREILMGKFGQFGQITSLDLKPSKTIRKEIKTQYAVIAYASEEEAEKAYAESRQIEDIIKFLFVSSHKHVKIVFFDPCRVKYKPKKPIQTHIHKHIHYHSHYPPNFSSQENHFQGQQPSWLYVVPTEPPGIYPTNVFNSSNKNQKFHQKKNFNYKEESKVAYEKPWEKGKELLDKSSFYENSGDISGMNLSNENDARHNDTFSFENARQNDLLKKNLNIGRNLPGQIGHNKFAREKY
jgi:RNA recognition motif-containing protein